MHAFLSYLQVNGTLGCMKRLFYPPTEGLTHTMATIRELKITSTTLVIVFACLCVFPYQNLSMLVKYPDCDLCAQFVCVGALGKFTKGVRLGSGCQIGTCT